MKSPALLSLWVSVFLCIPLSAQVQTEVPPVIPNAKPVTVEHIKVHGASLEGLRVDTAKLHDVLDKYSIPNGFEIYHGTHTSAVADRIRNHVMPYFNKNLCFTQGCR